MIGGEQPKFLVTIDKDGNLEIDHLQSKTMGITDSEYNWKLVRERDGLTKKCKKVLWLEWNEDGTFKEKWDNPAIGRSLVMSPFSDFFTWQTTMITEIVEQRDDYIKFKTKNSNYELFKL